mmetsp:Transcript_120960/g.240970  ORF Transcript_120960/g.240970 Transcript_120960/m.240970 type:complete len:109 (+) Transcript_120960:63-389(+)
MASLSCGPGVALADDCAAKAFVEESLAAYSQALELEPTAERVRSLRERRCSASTLQVQNRASSLCHYIPGTTLNLTHVTHGPTRKRQRIHNVGGQWIQKSRSGSSCSN